MFSKLIEIIIGNFRKLFREKSNRVRYIQNLRDLESRGLKKGHNVSIAPGAVIDNNYPYLISIGNNCVINPKVMILAHDSSLFDATGGYMRIGKVEIKDNCVVGTGTIILPNVTIGPNVIIAPGSVVNKDIPPDTCVAGVPARYYNNYSNFINHHNEEIKVRPVFDKVNLTKKEDEKYVKRKKAIIEAAKSGPVYIKGLESKYPVWVEEKYRR